MLDLQIHGLRILVTTFFGRKVHWNCSAMPAAAAYFKPWPTSWVSARGNQLNHQLFMKLMPKNCLLDCHTKHSRPILSFVNSHSAFVLIAALGLSQYVGQFSIMSTKERSSPWSLCSSFCTVKLFFKAGIFLPASHHSLEHRCCSFFSGYYMPLTWRLIVTPQQRWSESTTPAPMTLYLGNKLPWSSNWAELWKLSLQMMQFYSLFDIPWLILF